MFCALLAKVSGERLQDHWSSGFHSLLSLSMNFITLINVKMPIYPAHKC